MDEDWSDQARMRANKRRFVETAFVERVERNGGRRFVALRQFIPYLVLLECKAPDSVSFTLPIASFKQRLESLHPIETSKRANWVLKVDLTKSSLF